ncbi:LysR family transcriptional regulator [Streptomyces sp. Ru71]|uniref:LysR family transcriptional regulator n=1 Tax=Streptomyces sp. Ru71 TaxID=2080746 RepID=UPI000CDD0F02|nr:LysR family transcriptional regulator [Streptomyces sp. Ru71]POX57140.1 LysR family transcriptional regulator [Streptomyces sp. Ru71]
MQLQHLRAFCEVADELSFTRAAKNLNYAQSSITAQIRSLESTFGVPLFDRSRRQVTLTTAGERLLPHARRILQISEQAREDVRGAYASRTLRHRRPVQRV